MPARVGVPWKKQHHIGTITHHVFSVSISGAFDALPWEPVLHAMLVPWLGGVRWYLLPPPTPHGANSIQMFVGSTKQCGVFISIDRLLVSTPWYRLHLNVRVFAPNLPECTYTHVVIYK